MSYLLNTSDLIYTCLSLDYIYYAYEDFKPTVKDKSGVNLVKGEKVHVIDGSDHDWWLVRKESSGRHGWVPASYLIEEDEYKLQIMIKDRISSLPVNEGKFPNSKKLLWSPQNS